MNFGPVVVNADNRRTLNSHDSLTGVKMKQVIEMDLFGNMTRMGIE